MNVFDLLASAAFLGIKYYANKDDESDVEGVGKIVAKKFVNSVEKVQNQYTEQYNQDIWGEDTPGNEYTRSIVSNRKRYAQMNDDQIKREIRIIRGCSGSKPSDRARVDALKEEVAKRKAEREEKEREKITFRTIK